MAFQILVGVPGNWLGGLQSSQPRSVQWEVHWTQYVAQSSLVRHLVERNPSAHRPSRCSFHWLCPRQQTLDGLKNCRRASRLVRYNYDNTNPKNENFNIPRTEPCVGWSELNRVGERCLRNPLLVSALAIRPPRYKKGMREPVHAWERPKRKNATAQHSCPIKRGLTVCLGTS